MEYNDIYKSRSFEEQRERTIEYYKELNVEEWLLETTPQKIRMEDYTYFYRNKVLSNTISKAIIPSKPTVNEHSCPYWIKGESMTKEEWDKKTTIIKRKRRLKKINEIYSE